MIGLTRQAFYKRQKYQSKARLQFYTKADDSEVLAKIQGVIQIRPSYGYKRVTAMVNQKQIVTEKYNKKRIYRVMKKEGLLLPANMSSRKVHPGTGKIITLHSNTRWCSDCFEIECYNDERVYVAFSLDCRDREVMSYVATQTDITQVEIQNLMIQTVEARFGKSKAPREIQWLTDRGSVYRAIETQKLARSLGLKPCFTAAYSPASNGMAESLVKTIKRDYVYTNDCASADWVLRELPKWFDDYNNYAPHSGLDMLSPRQYLQSINLTR